VLLRVVRGAEAEALPGHGVVHDLVLLFVLVVMYRFLDFTDSQTSVFMLRRRYLCKVDLTVMFWALHTVNLEPGVSSHRFQHKIPHKLALRFTLLINSTILYA
jgi:hypothetical protein